MVLSLKGFMRQVKRKSQSHTWVGIIFFLILIFLVAQVCWWMLFQRHLIQQNLDYAQTSWLREAVLAQQLLTVSNAEDRAALSEMLREQFPYLHIDGEQVQVDSERLAKYRNQQVGYLRMLAFEGPFFLLVTLMGLWIIARSFRREQELKRRQQNFLLSATHEFRTPIGTLRLILDTLKMRELSSEKRHSYLQSMGHELSRLEDLSERLLATARLEQGLVSAQIQRQDLNQAMLDQVQILRPTLETRGAELKVEPWYQPLNVELDVEAFFLVLSNLLENALKYSPERFKPIWVRVLPQGQQVVVQVEDRGIGIAKELQETIFDPFFRAGNELTRETKGIGLGLYLVRSLMKLMNGQVVCESLEQGTRFSLMFPLAEKSYERTI